MHKVWLANKYLGPADDFLFCNFLFAVFFLFEIKTKQKMLKYEINVCFQEKNAIFKNLDHNLKIIRNYCRKNTITCNSDIDSKII